MSNETPYIEFQNVTKTFPGGVVANDDISFSIADGEIHGLLGENGAGKTTLMNVLYGLYEQDTGTILMNGEPLELDSPQEAIEAGIGMVHQHFMLIPRLSVVRNVILGMRESPFSERGTPRSAGRSLKEYARLLTLDLDTPRERIGELIDRYGMNLDPEDKVWQLDVGEQQRVEILKALYRDVDLLILDEPSAVLSPTEADQLYTTLKELIDEGLTIIVITHKLGEIMEHTDRTTVLRGGKYVDTVETDSTTRADLARMMVGREVLFEIDKPSVDIADPICRVTDLRANDDRQIEVLSEIDLEIRRGEIVGIAGVSGNGQKQLAECLAGVRDPTDGTIEIDGTDLTSDPPRTFIDAGVSFIPEDRFRYGCAPDQSIVHNSIMKDYAAFKNGLFLDYDDAREYAERLVEEFDVRVRDVETAAGNLSGGNLQKLILGRELMREPTFLIANQPTRGVDVGAIESIRNIILDQQQKGTGILLISESLDEVLELSDRVFVMYEGELVHETPIETADRDRISRYMAEGRAHADAAGSRSTADADATDSPSATSFEGGER